MRTTTLTVMTSLPGLHLTSGTRSRHLWIAFSGMCALCGNLAERRIVSVLPASGAPGCFSGDICPHTRRFSSVELVSRTGGLCAQPHGVSNRRGQRAAHSVLLPEPHVASLHSRLHDGDADGRRLHAGCRRTAEAQRRNHQGKPRQRLLLLLADASAEVSHQDLGSDPSSSGVDEMRIKALPKSPDVKV